MSELIVIDQGNFHKVDIDLKFTNTWELAHFPKFTESHLDQSVDFINMNSLQGFRICMISKAVVSNKVYRPV